MSRRRSMFSVARPRTTIAAIVIALVAAFDPEWAMAQTAPSEVQRLVHESWTFKDGAPEPSAFAQTADGYLWAGSPAGLFRFDGVRFELFRSPFGDSLRSTNISALLAANVVFPRRARTVALLLPRHERKFGPHPDPLRFPHRRAVRRLDACEDSFHEKNATNMQVMQARIARSRMAGEPPHVLVSPRLGHLGVLAVQQESDRFGQRRPRVDRTGCKIRSA